MNLEQLMTWWNLIFLVPLVLALVYLVVYMVTGVSFGEADADADSDVSVDVDADADADADADGDADADQDVAVEHDVSAEHDVEHDVEHDAEHDAEQDTEHGGGGAGAAALLSLVGVGKVPLSMVLVVLMVSWGLIGLVVNRVVYPWMPAEWLAVVVSVPVALLASVGSSGGLARLMARYMPTTETYVTSKRGLVGRCGETLYAVDETFGMAQVRDDAGDLHQVPCRTAAGKKPIGKDQRVVLYDYDAEKGVFYVAPFEVEQKPEVTARSSDDPDDGRRGGAEHSGLAGGAMRPVRGAMSPVSGPAPEETAEDQGAQLRKEAQ